MSFDIAQVQVERYSPPAPPTQGLEEAFLKYDDELVDEIKSFQKYLGGTALVEFRGMDFRRKVDHMAYIYGSGDYMRDKSIKLKALNMLKGFGDYMFHGEHDAPYIDHYVYDDKPYWLAVESDLESHLHELAEENGGSELVWPQAYDSARTYQTSNEYSWRVLGFSIDKVVSYDSNSPINARYEVSKLPESI